MCLGCRANGQARGLEKDDVLTRGHRPSSGVALLTGFDSIHQQHDCSRRCLLAVSESLHSSFVSFVNRLDPSSTLCTRGRREQCSCIVIVPYRVRLRWRKSTQRSKEKQMAADRVSIQFEHLQLRQHRQMGSLLHSLITDLGLCQLAEHRHCRRALTTADLSIRARTDDTDLDCLFRHLTLEGLFERQD